jgi:hypothetical protein
MRTPSLVSLAFLPVAVATMFPREPMPTASQEIEAAERLPADHFITSEECAVCHSEAPGANAMRSLTGDDVSPYGLWKATMMGNSFKDPYFHAQLQKESQSQGEHVQELCLRCHAPMAHHQRVMDGEDPPRLADLEDNHLADDSVSCTMCHQITAEGLGEKRTFSGRPVMGNKREIFGPFENPAVGPMQNHVNYTPVHAPHMQSSALCGSCHTLSTNHQGVDFPEQTPYLEWRNSVFSNEDGETEESRTCQQCHMVKTGPTRMARNPMGMDFLIPVREDYRSHAFVGGNAFMLDLMRRNAEELGIDADEDAMARTAAATRRQLGESTVHMEIQGAAVTDGTLNFDISLQNLTGHKFPTGYPARRAVLHVQVRRGRRVVFESGAIDSDGRIVGVEDEQQIPHYSVVTRPDQTVVYEMVAHDPDGRPTTYLTKMVGKLKDNRLLPKGWQKTGPHVEDTAPVGTETDLDFVGGRDTVQFRIPYEGQSGGLRIVAWLNYQSVPPVWVDALRSVESEQTRRFVRMYDEAPKDPETVAVAASFVQ